MKATLLLCLLLCAACSFAQVKKQRLIAIAEYEGLDTIPNGIQIPHLYDTASFTYGGSRHSTFDYNSMDYADLSVMYENQTSLLDKIDRILVPNNIDSAENALNIPFDSMYYFSWNGPLVPTEVAALRYYPDGAVMDEYRPTKYGPLTVQFIRYFGRLTVARYLSPLGNFDRFFGYDYYGNLAIDSAGLSNGGGQVFIYEFDNASRYVARTGYRNNVARIDTVEYRSHSYFPDGKVQTRRVGDQLDSFFYTPGVPGFTSIHTYSYTNGAPSAQTTFRYETHINALGQKDSLYYITGDTSFAYLTYDSRGNPLTKTTVVYYNTACCGGFRKHQTKYYYYEDYAPALAVPTIIPGPSFTISPNPVSTTLSLHYNAQVAAPLHIRISNTLSQLVHSETLIPQGANTNIALGSSLAPGIYSICVYGNGNSVLYTGKFLKE